DRVLDARKPARQVPCGLSYHVSISLQVEQRLLLRLAEAVLELRRRLEADRAAGRDLDGLASLGIASRTGSAILDGKGPETGVAEAAIYADGFGQRAENGVDEFCRLLLGQAVAGTMHVINEFCLGHDTPLLLWRFTEEMGARPYLASRTRP